MNEQDGAVLCLGRLWCDIIFTGLPRAPSPGEEVFARDVAIAPGGGAFITAAVLADAGRKAYLLSRLGLDPLSSALEPALRLSGVALDFLDRAAEAGPQPTVAMVQGGERAFVSRRAGAARPATLDAALACPGVRHLHVAEAATLFDLPDLIPAAKARNLSVSLDPSWDDDLMRRDDFLKRCAGVDIFMPNEGELDALCDGDLDAVAGLLSLVVVKRGAAGAVLASGAERMSRPATPVTALDSTGAGDSFNAGFLTAWLGARGLEASLAAGV